MKYLNRKFQQKEEEKVVVQEIPSAKQGAKLEYIQRLQNGGKSIQKGEEGYRVPKNWASNALSDMWHAGDPNHSYKTQYWHNAQQRINKSQGVGAATVTKNTASQPSQINTSKPFQLVGFPQSSTVNHGERIVQNTINAATPRTTQPTRTTPQTGESRMQRANRIQKELGLTQTGHWNPETEAAWQKKINPTQATPAPQTAGLQKDATGTPYYANEKAFQSSLPTNNINNLFKGINLQQVGTTTPGTMEQITPTQDLKSYARPVRFKQGGYFAKKKSQEDTSDQETPSSYMPNIKTALPSKTKDELGKPIKGKTGNMSGDELVEMNRRADAGKKAISKLKSPVKKEKGGYLKDKSKEESTKSVNQTGYKVPVGKMKPANSPEEKKKLFTKMTNKPEKKQTGGYLKSKGVAVEVGKEKSYKRAEVVPAAKKGMKSKTKKCSSGCGCKKTMIHKQGGIISTVCSCCGSQCN